MIDSLVMVEAVVAIVGGFGIVANAGALVVVAVIQSRASSRNHHAITAMAENVDKIEVATNSMKDDLVAATQKAGEAKGRDDERVRLGMNRKPAAPPRTTRGRSKQAQQG